jgi:nucleotide-binding universal stress UspA family protein
MFKHLVVPLDGSHLAEAALPAAAYIADKLGATVTLLHIIERDAPEAVHGERHVRTPEEAANYLDEVARRAFPPEIQVESHVHTTETANVASSIVAHGSELTMDLIIMCSHGRGGLGDWLSGSIAQQVVGSGKIPVLLIRPTESGPQLPFECDRILVPLDGNPEHEEGLPAAIELAQRSGAATHLLVVVPTLSTLSGREATAGRAAGRLLPGATRAVLDMVQQEAVAYLRRLAPDFQRQGVRVTAEVARGDPATVIIDTAQAIQADVIILGTHGKVGLDAFWSGSLSPRITSRLRLPLLLVPVTEPHAHA